MHSLLHYLNAHSALWHFLKQRHHHGLQGSRCEQSTTGVDTSINQSMLHL
jgi:hypothetical protein